ncbi:hypothetical protein PYW07_005463 [Mythimna separata]|uniref:CCHC-type domain-containing protein n=1 Tax=Mythimna separata TaxID=271217 RepID=A0AAD7YEV5_MYTSE|nr:hypothetical protein PYW07_005463 [Mythimna separata]
MDAVRAKTSKLNKDEIAAIGAHTVRLGAVIMQLSLRVAAAEQRAAIAEERSQAGGTQSDQLLAASTSAPPRSFANALKLGRGQEPVPIVRPPGPSVVIYPAEGQREALKTADDTRRVLLDAVRPGQLGLQIAGVRRVGNAGVVVQTTSAAAADTLRRAVPPTLRTVEPTERCPLIALTGIDKEATMEAVIRDLKEQNLHESDEWTTERLGRELRLVFRRGRHGNRSKWVCQASTDLRRTLITKGRIYLGWDVVEVTDHVSVTCCNKCQLYGHPEKYCRAKNVVCGNCGDEGHRSTECQAVNTACATCKKFGRKGAHGHRTAAKDCPARMHAEQQALPRIAEELGLDVVLVQEPYIAASGSPAALAQLLLPEGACPKAGVFLARLDVACAVLRHLCTEHMIVCHIAWGVSALHVVSAYFQYSDDVSLHLLHLERTMGVLRGHNVLVGADVNAHSPLWHSAPRHLIGRGREVARRRELVEGFVLAHGLTIHNRPGQPSTFHTINGESNIDVTMSTRGVRVTDWRVHTEASSSDHRLITFRLCGMETRGPAPAAESSAAPRRFRERGVDWDRFRAGIQERVGSIDWSRPASAVCKEFTRVIAWTAEECLGTCGDGKKAKGYEWWSPALEAMRKRHNKLRKAWQDARKVGGDLEVSARNDFHRGRSKYRAAMEKAQLDSFRKLADSGNQDPWGLAYRAASGRLRPPANVVNGVRLAEGFAGDVGGSMRGLLCALCPDDDLSRDTVHHRQVRLAAACIPSGRDAPPPSSQLRADAAARRRAVSARCRRGVGAVSTPGQKASASGLARQRGAAHTAYYVAQRRS